VHHALIDAVGYAAAVLTTSSFLPQLLRVIKLRSARDVSLGMFILMTVGTMLWLTYGIFMHALPMIAANGVTLVLSIAILMMKLRFDRHAAEPKQPHDAPR
jgi:MtN3 and saliva related transmembrane protein